ncbi:MAG: PDC sensor domain-containing protein [Gammaproteobacteria bacterium]|nr:PDC sensor domain-containing protein [Gammaproteobacteria bacterium]
MVNETKLQKAVSKQRQTLEALLFDSMSHLAALCAKQMDNIAELENLLSAEMSKAEYCKYLWVVDKTGRQIIDDASRTGFKRGQIGRDRIARPYMQRALKGDDYYLSEAYISRNRKRPSLTAIKSIRDDNGSVIGYLGADFDLRELPQTADQYEDDNIWKQIKGDPAIRSSLFSQQRTESAMDAQIDDILSLIEELILANGVFHAKLHFSSSRATLWLVDNPFVYQILNMDELSDPDICLAFRHQAYFDKAIVDPLKIALIFKQFKDLRFADETIYLRAASLNVVNGMVGLNFSCDGSHYMHYEEFLEKSMSFWFGD